jgi:hypothetical protein
MAMARGAWCDLDHRCTTFQNESLDKRDARRLQTGQLCSHASVSLRKTNVVVQIVSIRFNFAEFHIPSAPVLLSILFIIETKPYDARVNQRAEETQLTTALICTLECMLSAGLFTPVSEPTAAVSEPTAGSTGSSIGFACALVHCTCQ